MGKQTQKILTNLPEITQLASLAISNDNVQMTLKRREGYKRTKTHSSKATQSRGYPGVHSKTGIC